MDNIKEWVPDSGTRVIEEQTIISPISLKLCWREIADFMGSPQYKQGRGEFICSRLDELLAKSVGAITPSTLTLLCKENKAFRNTYNRRVLAAMIANETRLYLENKLAGEAKEIAFKSIDEWLASIENTPQQQSTPAIQEPSTERAKKAFAKAVEAGYMEKTDTGYKWRYNGGSKVSLGYFIMQVYSPDNTKQIPFKALGRLFGITRLERAVENASIVKKPQPWRGKIDNLLKEL